LRPARKNPTPEKGIRKNEKEEEESLIDTEILILFLPRLE
jgi:hypothetical protein